MNKNIYICLIGLLFLLSSIAILYQRYEPFQNETTSKNYYKITEADKNESFALGVDQWPDMKGLITISSVPFLAIQEDGYSDNDGIKRSWSNTFERAEEILNLVENNIPCE